MIDRLLQAFRTPRLWLSAAVVCFSLSIMVGYHQDQIAADSVLAEKVPSPETVLIQDYDPGLHSNLLREVHFLAEADMSKAIRQNVGSDAATRVVEVVPVFPVTRLSAPLAASLLNKGAPRRPMSRSAMKELKRGTDAVRAIETMPVGLIVSEGHLPDDLTELGDGLNGPLVSFLGAEIGNGDVFEQAARAFAREGLPLLDDIPVVWLYPQGKRPATAVADFTWLRHMLVTASFVLMLTGGALTYTSAHRRKVEAKRAAFAEVETVGDFPSMFVPIERDQEERIRAEQDASERRAAHSRRVLSRVVES